jgi:hypothetical protein
MTAFTRRTKYIYKPMTQKEIWARVSNGQLAAAICETLQRKNAQIRRLQRELKIWKS